LEALVLVLVRETQSTVQQNILDATVDITGFSTEETRNNQDGKQTELKDKRKRNKLLRHECKTHMMVGKRNGMTFFYETTHAFYGEATW
jgi:hypothetical protein